MKTEDNEVRLLGHLVGWAEASNSTHGIEGFSVSYYDFESIKASRNFSNPFSTPCLHVNFTTGIVIIHKHIPSSELGWDTRPESLPDETTIISLLHDLCLRFSEMP